MLHSPEITEAVDSIFSVERGKTYFHSLLEKLKHHIFADI